MKLGRNDPCSCGSGLKYKKCCLPKEAVTNVVSYDWQKLRRTEGELVNRLGPYSAKRYGQNCLLEAWDDFTLWEDVPMQDHPDFETTFMPWFIFNWSPDNSERDPSEHKLPEAPIAMNYLEEHGSELDDYEKRFIETICSQPYSFFVIKDSVPRESLLIEDILFGGEHRVWERKGSEVLKRGDIIYSRVVDLDGAAVMIGTCPYAFPPRFHHSVIDFRKGIRKSKTKSTAELTILEIRSLYFSFVEAYTNPQMPRITNTDGEPMVQIQVRYDLKCSPQSAFDRLKSLHIDEDHDHLLENAKRQPDGSLQAVNFDWLKLGNKKHKSWDNTVMGRIAISGDELTVDVNSDGRSKKIQREIKKRFGEGAVFKIAVADSIEHQLQKPKLPRELKREEEHEELQKRPEVQAKLKEMMEAHWANWYDSPVPLLLNKTPRQAAKSKEGRGRLEALLLEYERHSLNAKSPHENLLRPDISAMRKELGLN